HGESTVPFSFEFSPEHRLLQRSVRAFLRQEVEPRLPKDDWTGHGGDPPLDLVRKMMAQGLLSVPIPRELGGSGLGEVGYCITMEETAAVDSSLCTILGAHTGIGMAPIYLFGNEEQRERFVRPIAEGKEIAAFALTEPTAGSDAASIRTKARKEGNEYVLNGTKIWCSNGSFADTIVTFAVTDETLGAHGGVTAFLVPKDTPGLRVGTIEDKLGIRQSATAELVFEDLRVPKENVLGRVGEGFIVALTALDGGRVGLAAATLGATKRLLADCTHRATVRERYGKPIAKNQAIQWTLADMATDIHLAQYAVYHAAALVDQYYHKIAAGEPVPRVLREQVSRAAAACKIFCSEMSGRHGEKAIQLFGGDGIRWRYGIERSFRDQVITEIYEGTNEIQRLIIARELLQEASA
ncbi:MAG TPA: acyl-CoA dehydrogenase family protein, partial [Candidatus Thermoplasmatota archaeon]|nr:acyl-CoA dehydrogenase family protein [Candidatus Thermoplasmatota archaeon]